ncbi:hypothetical protein [Streptomyces sp. NPDC046832]|uniref:hypothetical protein n=1 Tax=Streptomyces sp. NPDC046832 TaxID=3155020 RepID=UPI0033E233CB
MSGARVAVGGGGRAGSGAPFEPGRAADLCVWTGRCRISARTPKPLVPPRAARAAQG